MVRAFALVFFLGLLPGCGAASLLSPLIDDALDDIFGDDQTGDQIEDDTEIGQAATLEIAMSGRYCCDPANGADQRVTVLTIGHDGPAGSDPIDYEFVPESGSKLFAVPAGGRLSRGEVATVEVFASDCDFEFQDFRLRTFFVGDAGEAGRSTTALLTVTNICSDLTPALIAAELLGVVRDDYIDAVTLEEFGEPVKHGDVSVPAKIPAEPLSEISYHAMARVSLDAMDLEDLFTGSGALYPVGDGVYEADSPAVPVAGDYLVGIVAVDGLFALMNTTREWRFGLCFDSDGDPANDYDPPAQTADDPARGTDRWYFLDFSPGGGWSLRLIGSDGVERTSAARVIRVANALLFVVPASEVPGPGAGYRALTFTHTGDFGLGPDHDWAGDHHPLSGLAAVPE